MNHGGNWMRRFNGKYTKKLERKLHIEISDRQFGRLVVADIDYNVYG